jgi:hypothetical protein
MITTENWTENEAKELNDYLDFLDYFYPIKEYKEVYPLIFKNLGKLFYKVKRRSK